MTIRQVAEQARSAATRAIGEAQVVSVAVALERGTPTRYDTVCVHEARSLWGRPAVRTCQVSSRLDGGVTRTSVSEDVPGTLTDLTANARVPPVIPIECLVVEPDEVLRRLRDDPIIPWSSESAERQLDLSAWRAGTPEWCAQYEVDGLGQAAVFIAAETGVVGHEQLHVAHTQAVAALRFGGPWERVGNAISLARQLAGTWKRLLPADARVGPIARCRQCDDLLVQLSRPGHAASLAVAAFDPPDVSRVVRWVTVDPDTFTRRFVHQGEHLSRHGPRGTE